MKSSPPMCPANASALRVRLERGDRILAGQVMTSSPRTNP
jgi:hypothetical protein